MARAESTSTRAACPVAEVRLTAAAFSQQLHLSYSTKSISKEFTTRRRKPRRLASTDVKRYRVRLTAAWHQQTSNVIPSLVLDQSFSTMLLHVQVMIG